MMKHLMRISIFLFLISPIQLYLNRIKENRDIRRRQNPHTQSYINIMEENRDIERIKNPHT